MQKNTLKSDDIVTGTIKANEQDFDNFRNEMEKSIQSLDAEWLKKDTLKSLRSRNPNDQSIAIVERMEAEVFKEEMIKGLSRFDSETFVKAVEGEREKYGLDKQNAIADFKSEEPVEIIQPNYGFEPRQRFDPAELRARLNETQYLITQFSSSEYPNTGDYVDHWEKGVYNCVICDKNLFSSEHKIESLKGYATFHDTIGDIKEQEYGTNVVAKCENCGSNLGDIITGDRGNTSSDYSYVINSASLNFKAFEFID